jgi:hypothetical protein
MGDHDTIPCGGGGEKGGPLGAYKGVMVERAGEASRLSEPPTLDGSGTEPAEPVR